MSQDTKIPAGDVPKVGVAILERFARLIDEQQNLASPLITLTAVTTRARPAACDKPAVPAGKVARMAIRQKLQPHPPSHSHDHYHLRSLRTLAPV